MRAITLVGAFAVAVWLTAGVASASTPTVSFNRPAARPFVLNGATAGIAVGDLNGDGKLDVAIAEPNDNGGAGEVQILLGRGDGTFAAGPTITNAGPNPVAIAAVHLYNTSALDLTVVDNDNGGQGWVTVLQNNGSGSFTNVGAMPVGSGPNAIATGDLNHDGIPDLVVNNNGDSTVSSLLNSPAGHLFNASGSPFSLGGLQGLGIALGDFSGSGNLDLVAVGTGTGGSGYVVGQGFGDGTFNCCIGVTPLNSSASSDPSQIAVGDFNGDGRLDFAATDFGTDTTSVLLGTGDTFAFDSAPGSPFATGFGTNRLAVGDFNLDGNPDLALPHATSGGGTVGVYTGGGLGDFLQASGSPFTVAPGPTDIAVGDFNGDGYPDIVTADSASNGSLNTVSVLLDNPQHAVFGTSLAPFAPQTVGTASGAQLLAVDNTGGVPLTVRGVTIGGVDADQFKVVEDSCSFQTVPVSGACRISIKYTPTAAGTASAFITVPTDGPSGSSLFQSLSGSAFPQSSSGLSFASAANPLFGTGYNAAGALGTGGTVRATTPAAVKGPGTFVGAAAGNLYSLGLANDGTVWAWGRNNVGQLGTGDTVDAHLPVHVPVLNGVMAVAAGFDHSLALRADGTTWAWGDNSKRQFGNPSLPTSSSPAKAAFPGDGVAVAAGNSFSLLLTRDGTVWSAGINTLGQLGHGSIDSQESVAPVAGLASGGISSGVAIAAGSNHALALKSDGTVWAWGANDSGQLGNGCTIGSNCSTSSTPVQVSGLTNVVAIAAGGSHSLALKSDGTVWAWGLNSNGQLGNNSTTSSSTPVQVTGLPFITQIAAGQLDSQAIDRSGDLYGWGANGNGQLGVGNTNDQLVATFVTSIHNGAELLAPGSQADHTLFIGEPYLKVTSANPVIFPSETPGTPSPSQSVTVLNNGVVPVAIAQAAIVGSDGDEFSFAGDGCSGTTVQPFKTCTISIRYDPKINAKAVATLTIPSNGANPPVAVTLDPPAVAAAPTSHAPAVKWVVCGHSRVRRGHLVVRCRLRGSGAGVARRDSRRLTARLTRGGRLLARGSGRASSTGAATITLRLPRRLRAGSYRLTVTATGAAAAWRSLRL